MIQSTKHALILDTAFLSIVLSKMLKKCHQYNVYKLNEIYINHIHCMCTMPILAMKFGG